MRRSLSGTAAAAAKPAAPVDVQQLLRRAQAKVFGTDFGDHRRSGRKRLRSHLRGPSVKGYYGFNFDDVLPNAVTTMKEDFFRDEELLNRIGKTRIKGKMKEPLKDMVETMKFEDEVEDLTDSLTPVRPSEFLLAGDLATRVAQLEHAKTPQEAAAINDVYARLAASRERTVTELATHMSEAKMGRAEEKAKKGRGGTFQYRRGMEDKRQWDEAAPAAKVDKQAGSPAAGTYAPGAPGWAAPGPDAAPGAAAEGAAAPPTPAFSSEDDDPAAVIAFEKLEADPHPVIRGLASTLSWKPDASLIGDPAPTAKALLDESFRAWAAARGSATWAALELVKDEPLYRSVWSAWEVRVEGAGGTMGKEGVAAVVAAEAAEERAAMEAEARAEAKRVAPLPAVPAAAAAASKPSA